MKVLYYFLIISLASNILANSKGERIYRSKCMTCHNNTSDQISTPFLYGQEKRFLENSLKLFKNDQRIDLIMGPMNSMAKGLSPKDIRNVSQYLAAKDQCEIPLEIDPKVPGWIEDFREGQALAKEKNCMHCHGSFHHAAPRLYGQKKSYLIKSLRLFQNEQRPAFFKMIEIAKNLSENDIDKLSHYFYGMRLMRDCSK